MNTIKTDPPYPPTDAHGRDFDFWRFLMAEPIAEHLSTLTASTWRRETQKEGNEHMVSIRGPGNERLWFRLDERHKRMEIHGDISCAINVNGYDLLSRTDRQELTLTIYCSANRPSEAIARDISRRLLPDLRKALTIVAAAHQRNLDYDTGRRAMICRLATQAGPQFKEDQDGYGLSLGYHNGVYGDIKAQGVLEVEFHLRSVPEEAAGLMLRALAAYLAFRPAQPVED